MKYLFFIVIGYIVLYLTVWLHEVGHSIWDCLFGVKQGWLKVNVKPYIFFSTPGELDIEAWNNLNSRQYVLIAYGGIIANAIWALITGIIIKVVPISNLYINMAIIAQHMPKLRIVNICVGFLLTVLYIFLLVNVPGDFQVFIVIWNVITVVSMCSGRIIFSTKSKRA